VKFKIILSLLLFYGILFSQDKICEFNDDDDVLFAYRTLDVNLLCKENIDIFKQMKKVTQLITYRELENLSVLKNDTNFREIARKYALETDFSFSSVEKMFKEYSKVPISEKYNLAKSQLDKFFMEKDLLNKSRVGRITFLYYDKDFDGEINVYDYVYCKNARYLDYYALNNTMLKSINPFDDDDDIYYKNLIGFEETKNFKRYTMPIVYEGKTIYNMSIHYIKPNPSTCQEE
jgi:hypothetical protein